MTFLQAMDAVTLIGEGAVVRRESWGEAGGFVCRDGQLEFRLGDGDGTRWGAHRPSDEELLTAMDDIASHSSDDAMYSPRDFDVDILGACLTPEDLSALDWLVE